MPDLLSHPSPEELAAFVAGRLPADRQRQLERHIGECAACCDVLAKLPEDTLAARLRTDDLTGTAAAGRASSPGRVDPATLPIPPELVNHPRYRVVRCLGVGGMGAAYLAEHRRMQRPVVLKVVRRELLSDPAVAERFQREVQAAARLSHPNIVQAYDADQAGDLHFLVMEYVEGRTLAEVAAKHGPLPVAHACHYARQAAAGLRHAHEKGMVHRDVKPQNLMLTPAGQVKILDFGLAQFARELDESPQAEGATTAAVACGSATIVTAAGAVFGTPDYIAPEQTVSARDVDIRADIYGLGCTLYFLLQGRPPFPNCTSSEKLAAHRTRPLPPLSDVREPIPDALRRVVERMTAKRPDERYATPDEVVRALAPFTKSPPPNDEPAATASLPVVAATATAVRPRRKSRRVPLIVAAASAVVIVAAVVFVWLRRRANDAEPVVRAVPRSVASSATAPATVRGPTVLVVLPRQFQTFDYVEARRVWEQAGGLRVQVAATGPCRPVDQTFGDSRVEPDLTLPGDVLRAADYDALYLAGGNIHEFKDAGPVRDAVWRLIDEFVAAGKPVASIGTGQGILAFRGTLAERTVSVSPVVAQFMPRYAATMSNEPVAADGPILTAGDSQSAPLLAKKLALLLRQQPSGTAP